MGRWDGKGKGRQPIENTFVAGETATTISSWAVSANSRHFPRKMATTSLAAPHSTLPTTIHQLPTPNANRPDRESLVRRQAHWAGYTIIGCCCYCHHFIIVVVSSSAQDAAMNVVVLFLSPRRLLFAIVVAPELWPKGTAKAQSCSQSQSQSHCRRGAQRSRQASGGDRGIRRPSDIDDCQTPSELLASFVAASVSLVGLQIANRSGIRWIRINFMCFISLIGTINKS